MTHIAWLFLPEIKQRRRKEGVTYQPRSAIQLTLILWVRSTLSVIDCHFCSGVCRYNSCLYFWNICSYDLQGAFLLPFGQCKFIVYKIKTYYTLFHTGLLLKPKLQYLDLSRIFYHFMQDLTNISYFVISTVLWSTVVNYTFKSDKQKQLYHRAKVIPSQT